MNKVPFFLLSAFAAILLFSCEPAREGGGESAPSSFHDGVVEEIGTDPAKNETKTDSAVIKTNTE